MQAVVGWVVPERQCREPAGCRVEVTGRQTWSSALRPGVLRVRCLSGAAWVTQAGESRDVVLRREEELVTAPRGKVVVQALSDAAVVLVTRL